LKNQLVLMSGWKDNNHTITISIPLIMRTF